MENVQSPKLLVHVPHASTYIPEDVWPEFIVSRERVEAEAIISADLYTDEMAKQAWPNAKIIQAQISRIVVDVERYDDDNLEEMAAKGRGVLYTHDHKGFKIRNKVSEKRRKELLARHYRPHWKELKAQASEAILIDLHTYPSEPWSIECHAQGSRPEIDIGFTPSLTPLSWVSALSKHFSDLGYEVGHNTPYEGVIDTGAKAAVMIEIRRDVVGQPSIDPKWKRLIAALSKIPLGEAKW